MVSNRLTNKVFFDASVLFAAAYSSTGAARELIRFSTEDKIKLVVSQFFLEEARRNLAEKAPAKVAIFATLIATVELEIVPQITKEEILAVAAYTKLKDAPVVAAAIKGQCVFLVTYDRKHLIEPAEVADKSGLKIVTPDIVLNVVREQQNDE